MDVNRDMLNNLYVNKKNLPVCLRDIHIDKSVVQCIPEGLASKYNLMPIEIKNNKIIVAMSNPADIFVLEDIKIVSGYEVEPVKAESEEIKKIIEKYYSRQSMQRAAEEIVKEYKIVSFKSNNKYEVDNVKNAPAVRMVNSILKNAVESRASDVHIEPFEDFVKVRYRVDGEMQDIFSFARDALGAIITRIKILANLNTAEKRLPQDGKMFIKVDEKSVEKPIDFRVSILPTIHGEKVVIRILTKDNFLVGKQNLGISSEELVKLDRMLKIPNGLILVTGPTGSGKSTTLYSILKELNTSNRNIVTIEDPAEYILEGINQVSVNANIGLTFAAGLRSILRQDPDIIMIGEIRDFETAEIAIRAAITGHIVLSTIHTNDAPSAAIRLIDMGVEPYLVANAISGVLSQRLIRKICRYCDEEYYASEHEKQILGLSQSSSVKLHRGKTCHYCDYTGYLGRTGVFEVMEITKQHRDLISQKYSTSEIRDLSIKNGMKTLKDSCRELVLNGVTTIEELAKITCIKE